jgi:hypothetical protein
LRVQDAIFGERDMRNVRVQIEIGLKEDGLLKVWNKIFGLETPERFRDIMKDLGNTWKDIINKNPEGINIRKQESARYQLATIFALDVMNAPENMRQERAEMISAAIDAQITKLEAVEKRNVAQDNKLTTYKAYAEVQPLVSNIVNRQGNYGAQINDYIENTYKPLTNTFWGDFDLKEFSRAVKVDYYSPRVFVEKLLENIEGEYNLATDTGRLIERQNEDLSTAMAQGREFAYLSFMPALAGGMSQAINAQANRRAIKNGIAESFFTLESQEGFERLNAAGAKHTEYHVTIPGMAGKVDRTTGEIAGRQPGARKIFTDYEEAQAFAKKYRTGVKIVNRDLYAPAEIARYFNRITKASEMRKNPWILGLLAANAKLKGLKIVWGMFHRRSFIWSAMIAGAVHPDMQWMADEMEEKNNDALQKLKHRFNYGDRRKLGMQIMNQASREFYALSFYGQTSFRIQDIGRASQLYQTRAEKWLAGASRGPFTQSVNRNMKKFMGVTHRLQDELFGIFGSTLKAATAYNEYMTLMKKHNDEITRQKEKSRADGLVAAHRTAYYDTFKDQQPKGELPLEDYHSELEVEILRGVAGMANADFGGMHVGRLGVTKDFQDIMRLLFLGPDWTASNIISATKLAPAGWLRQQGQVGPGSSLGGSALERKIYQRFWLRIIGRSLLLATVINALMAGLDDESALERLRKAKRRKGFKFLMADISPVIHMLGGDEGVDHYFNVSGHFLDIPKIAFDPFRMGYHKSSAVLKPVLDLVGGTRYDHKRPAKLSKIGQQGLYTWKNQRRGPLSPEELPAYMIYQIFQLLPIQMRNVFDVAVGEQNAITGLMRSGLGLDVRRTYGR